MSIKSDKDLITISTLKRLKEKGEKFGFNTMFGNLALQIGYTNDNKNNDGLFGSIKLVLV